MNTTNTKPNPLPYDYSSIPEELRERRRWVCWRAVPRKDGKVDKIPLNARTGRGASVSAPETWSSFDETLKAYHARPDLYTGLGFVFSKEDNLVFVDLDDATRADRRPNSENIYKHIYTWVELSQSGKGIHLIAKGRLPENFNSSKKNGVEAYSHSRFVAMTGWSFGGGRPTTINETQEGIDWLYREFSGKSVPTDNVRPIKTTPANVATPTPATSTPATPETTANTASEFGINIEKSDHKAPREKLLAALACVYAEDHDTWRDMGFALHSTGWPDAFDIWKGWAQSTRKNNYEAKALSRWKSFRDDKESKITAGTIIHRAQQNGFDKNSVEPSSCGHPAAVYWRARHAGKTVEEALRSAQEMNSALGASEGGPLASDALERAFAWVDGWERDFVPDRQDWIAQPLAEDQHKFNSAADAVVYLNQRIAYLPQDNMIIDRALTDTDGDPFRYIRVRDAKDVFANVHVAVATGGKATIKQAFNVWMQSPYRREYRKVVFDGSGDTLPPRTLNLWRGFGVQPKAGECRLICKHIGEVICGRNLEQYQYLMRLLAFKVQHPHLPTEVALVLRTDEEGAGKDTLLVILEKIFGDHYRVAASPDHLFKWNAGLLADASVVYLGELLWSGNHQYAGRFKEMITAKRIGTEAKFAPPGNTVNTALYVISSNADWVVPAGRDARRFFVPDVSSAHVGDTAYFDALYAEINGDGPAALLHDLLALDLGNWHPRDAVPQTGALKDQKLQSLDPVGRWWQDCLDDGEVAFDSRVGRQTIISAADWSAGPVIADKEKMRQAYFYWASTRRLADRKGITTAEMFKQLRKYAPGGTYRTPGAGTRRGAQFTDHATCVADFEAALKRK